jgi:prophage regulatory protein
MTETDSRLEIIDYKELRKIVPFSKVHLLRLERAGHFPPRVRLTDHHRGRAGWIRGEIQTWVAKRAALRVQLKR